MEGIINPLTVREPWRCSACGMDWMEYELEEDATDDSHRCPRCGSGEIARLGG